MESTVPARRTAKDSRLRRLSVRLLNDAGTTQCQMRFSRLFTKERRYELQLPSVVCPQKSLASTSGGFEKAFARRCPLPEYFRITLLFSARGVEKNGQNEAVRTSIDGCYERCRGEEKGREWEKRSKT